MLTAVYSPRPKSQIKLIPSPSISFTLCTPCSNIYWWDWDIKVFDRTFNGREEVLSLNAFLFTWSCRLHSDQETQYISAAYRRETNVYGITPSMSRKVNCYDNAMAKIFFSTLKTGWIYCHKFTSVRQANQPIGEYLLLHPRANSATNFDFAYCSTTKWSELCDTASFEAKIMIVNCPISRVEVFRDYKLHIDFNIALDQFFLGLDIVSIAA